MGSRYESARAEIKAILQRQPDLTAKELWHELTTFPVPSVRSIQRFVSTTQRAAQGAKEELAVAANLAAGPKNHKRKGATFKLTDRIRKELQMPTTTDEKLDSISTHLDKIHGLCDSLSSRMDAYDNDKSDAAAAVAAAESKNRFDAEAQDKGAFATAQMNCDAAYNAWGKRAPFALHGETLRDFRIRLLTALKAHSRRYCDSDLTTIGDEKVFSEIESKIINDAVEASSSNDGAAGLPLRMTTKVNDMGHRITTFHGDPAVCWAPFMGGHTRFGRIVRPSGPVSGFNS
jgi:hypothetical protein